MIECFSASGVKIGRRLVVEIAVARAIKVTIDEEEAIQVDVEQTDQFRF